MDAGKFFRGLSKVNEGNVSPETMRRMLEADDRLLGISRKEAPSVSPSGKIGRILCFLGFHSRRIWMRKIEVGDKVKLKKGIRRSNTDWDSPSSGGFVCEVIGIEVGDSISFSHRLFFGNPSVVYILKHNQGTSAFLRSEIARIVMK